MNYKPVVAGNQSNGNACTKACNVWQSTNNVNTASDGNSTNNVNAVSSTVNAAGIKVNVVGAKTSIELPNDPNMPELEDIVTQMNIRCCAEADMNNLNTFIPKSLCTEFEKMIHEKFQMSSIDELTFFLGLQVKQKEDEIFISQDKYVTEIFGQKVLVLPNINDVKHKPLKHQKAFAQGLRWYLKGQPKLGLWYPKDLPFDLVAYTDSDYAGASLDRKSTTGDSNEKKLIQMIKIHTDKNVADLLTKAFDVSRFQYLIASIGNAHFKTSLVPLDSSVKTVNKEQQLQALVDGKKIIITEATVRWDLLPKDANGVDSTNQKFSFSKYIFESMVKNLDNAVKFLMPKEKDTQVPQSSVPSDPTNVEDVVGNEEPSMKLKELMDFCTKLQQRVLDLENTKTTQAQEITSLKKRVKKLEKKGGSRTHKLKRLYREDASKQGRKIDDIDVDEDITLENVHDADLFGVNNLDGDEVVVESKVTDKAGEKRNIVEEAVTVTDVITILVTAAIINNVELTLAQTLTELKSARPKTKGVVMQEPSESTPTISLQLPSQVKGQGSKDKAKFDEEDRLAREKAQQVEEANIAWNDIQVKIDADYQLAERLQAQEQQELTIKEKSTLFVQFLEKRKKHFGAKRAEEKRNMPPTRAQQRCIMCTYLKNMAGWKPKDLKNKSFANIQELFNKAFKRVNTFVDFRIELVEGTEMEESSKKAEVMEESSKRVEGSETRQESSSKRAGDELEQENAKKQKMDDNQEAAKMKELMKIIPDEKEVAVDAIPLATKPLNIIDWKIMLRSFDREDLETLWKLVKAKHGYTRLEEGYERVLWGDLKTMFEHHVEDAVWRNLWENKVLVWKLFDSCGVHFVRFQNMHVFMLVEKIYPLIPATITDMLNKKLQADHWNEMCYQLLKLVTKQLKNQ
ncbi:hypothetical protein Tco_0844494 [Tanacetum coccineum]